MKKNNNGGLLAALGALTALTAAAAAAGYALYRRRQDTRLIREIDVMLEDENAPSTAEDLCVCQDCGDETPPPTAADGCCAGSEEDIESLCQPEEDEEEQ